jgi:uncharacterized protein (UPF0333 family)
MDKKGQAAMEFLMTYGWAILAAIIVIGVLAIYFRPSQLTQNSVVVTAPLYGVGVTFTATQIQVEVKNNGGESLNTTAATLTFTNPTGGTCGAGSNVGVITAGTNQVITFSTCNLGTGNTVNADIAVSYIRPGSTLTLQSTGTITGKVP